MTRSYTPPQRFIDAMDAVGWRLVSLTYSERPPARWSAAIARKGGGLEMRFSGPDPDAVLDVLVTSLLSDTGAVTADGINHAQILDLDQEVTDAAAEGRMTSELQAQGELCHAALGHRDPPRRAARLQLATILNRRARARAAGGQP